MSTIDRYIGRRELLRELGVSKSTLIRWTTGRGFPKSLPNSGRVPVYDRAVIDEWLRRKVTTEAR
jgi:predicted DNA-binding transcriptional regulator AlpA